MSEKFCNILVYLLSSSSYKKKKKKKKKRKLAFKIEVIILRRLKFPFCHFFVRSLTPVLVLRSKEIFF